jgi:hypothetical protein
LFFSALVLLLLIYFICRLKGDAPPDKESDGSDSPDFAFMDRLKKRYTISLLLRQMYVDTCLCSGKYKNRTGHRTLNIKEDDSSDERREVKKRCVPVYHS